MNSTNILDMQRSGSNGEHPLVIQHPTTLEPLTPSTDSRPWAFFGSLTDGARGHLVAMLGEYIGTTMFLFFGYTAAQTANEKNDITLRPAVGATDSPSGPSLIQISYISATFGLSLFVNVFVWYRVSGGMFNPSVSFGLWLAGAFDWIRLVCVIPMQCLGAITAAGLVSGLVPGPLLAESSLGAGVSIGQGLVMEAILTSLLMITILMLAVEKSRVSFMAPAMIGIAVLIIHLVGINVSSASVNPARTLGPAVVNQNFVTEFWIYFVGPTLGAAVMAGLHLLLKAMAYQSANPGQDGDGMEYYRIVPPSGREIIYDSPSSYVPPLPAKYPSRRRRDVVVDDDEAFLLRDLRHYKPRRLYTEINYERSGENKG